MRRLWPLILVLSVIAACDPAPTQPPSPIATPTMTETATATVTATPSATATPSTTATPSVTATPWPTCAPQLTGDLVISAWVDADDDNRRTAGEQPVSVTLLLSYPGLLPEPYPTYWQITTMASGIWAGPMIPGLYNVMLKAHDAITLTPPYNYPIVLWISAGNTTMYELPFGSWAIPHPSVTPIPTMTAIVVK